MPTITPVTADEFTTKFTKAIMIFFQVVGGVVVPVTLVVMSFSVFLLIMSFFAHSSNLKKLGFGGLLGSAGGLILFKAIPLILGLWLNISKALQ